MVLFTKGSFVLVNNIIIIGFFAVNIFITYNIWKQYGAALGNALSHKDNNEAEVKSMWRVVN